MFVYGDIVQNDFTREKYIVTGINDENPKAITYELIPDEKAFRKNIIRGMNVKGMTSTVGEETCSYVTSI